MLNSHLVNIKVARVINAPKLRVMRLFTKIWQLPEYLPTVKEVSVLERKHNIIRSRWHIQVDEVPIKWIEEDTFLFRQGIIRFHSIEGDLQEFLGEWRFSDHPEGTEVQVSVYLDVGIPAIRDFANEYIRKQLCRNFEAILETLERRLVSIRYSGFKSGDAAQVAGFGVIGHFYNYRHLERSLKMLKPDYRMPSIEFLGSLFNLTPSFKMHDVLDFRSETGDVTSGIFILATFIPDMIEKDMWAIFAKVVKACKIAEKYAVGVVSLGGFTSIIAERIGHEIAGEVDVPVTTGNTFTAAMVIEGVRKACAILGLEPSGLKATIVGGTGDIGSACARVLVDEVKELTITGRTKSNLKRIGAELSKKRKAKITATMNNEAAIRNADIVIACASVTASILKVDWFKPGAVICDVGYPKNISYAPVTRDDILIFSGGLTKSPSPISFPVDTGLPCADTLYGCFAEAIILSLEKRFESYSFGRGNITAEKINEIVGMGAKHGFTVADFYWGDKLVGPEILAKVKAAAALNKTRSKNRFFSFMHR